MIDNNYDRHDTILVDLEISEYKDLIFRIKAVYKHRKKHHLFDKNTPYEYFIIQVRDWLIECKARKERKYK